MNDLSSATKRIVTRLIARRRPDTGSKYTRLGRTIDSRAVHPRLCTGATGGRIVFTFYVKGRRLFVRNFTFFSKGNGIGF